MATLYRQFAENLMILSSRYGSIAEVCRQTGINRQQFNKYLSGKTLPNEHTLSKISGLFGIPDIELFAKKIDAKDEGKGRAKTAAQVQNNADYWNTWRQASEACNFPTGNYSMFGRWPAQPEKIFRGYSRIFRVEGETRYSRIIRFRAGPPGFQKLLSSRIDGFGVQAGSQITFTGRERRQWHGFFATACFNLDFTIAVNIWPGLALSYMPNGLPVAFDIVLKLEPEGTQVRQLLQDCEVYAPSHEAIPGEVAQALEAARDGGSGLLCGFDYNKLLRKP